MGITNWPEPPVEPDDPQEMPRCPECGAECEWLYRDRGGLVVGCENCVDALSALDYRELTI